MRSALVILSLMLPLVVPAQAAKAETAKVLPPPFADYHLHIQGAVVSEELVHLKARDPKIFEGMNDMLLKPRSGTDALHVLDEAGIRHGVLLSEAYMFASPLMAPDKPDVPTLTREENAYNVSEAAKSGGRLVAFIGVDPLSPTALPEIAYWHETGGATGIKLHLANSMFDFSAPTNLEALKGVFAAARADNLPIIVHLRNRVEWGPAQVNEFVEQVLPSAEGLPVQIAHAAGWGGLDEPTIAALSAFSEAIAAHRPGTEKLTFDLAVILADTNTDDQLRRFVAVMRSIGMDHFAMASDWPAITPAEQVARLEHKLPLTADEWRVILAHRAGYFGSGQP